MVGSVAGLWATDGMDPVSQQMRGLFRKRIRKKDSCSWKVDDESNRWDHPTMKLIADQKRRVVLPKPAEPGDVFEVIESGDRLVLVKLVRPKALRPPLAPIAADSRLLKGIDLDEPAFAPISDESPA
jgi:hypothetical protein